jgi:hypothetical protein
MRLSSSTAPSRRSQWSEAQVDSPGFCTNSSQALWLPSASTRTGVSSVGPSPQLDRSSREQRTLPHQRHPAGANRGCPCRVDSTSSSSAKSAAESERYDTGPGCGRFGATGYRGRIGPVHHRATDSFRFRNRHLTHFGMGTRLTPIRRPMGARRTLKTRLARPGNSRPPRSLRTPLRRHPRA